MAPSATPVDHVHQPLDEETTAIGGHYVLTAEERLDVDGRDLLVLVGHAVFDTTCCGTGGCGYAVVPGFVEAWKDRTDDDGRPVSRVVPVRDDALRTRLDGELKQRFSVLQVRFL